MQSDASATILVAEPRDPQDWASECPGVKNYKWQLKPVWRRMLYSCTRMATVGVKGLKWATHGTVGPTHNFVTNIQNSDATPQWPTTWWTLAPACSKPKYRWHHLWNKSISACRQTSI